MAMGMNPFATHNNMPFAQPRRDLHHTARVDPIITTATRDNEYCVTVKPPPAHTLTNPAASPLDARSIRIEGRLTPKAPTQCDYVTRARTAVYAEPSRAAMIGYVPAGTVIRGSAPSNRGWIALDDDESYVLDDGSLALQRGAPHGHGVDFAKRVQLPDDALLSRATLTRGGPSRAGESGKWRVVYGPRIAVRSGTHTNASLLGVLARGDVVSGTVDDLDPNWLRLSAASSHTNQPAFVMIRHPSLGTLIAPADGPAEQQATEDAITIHVPRLAPNRTAKRPAPSPHAATPAASSPRAPQAAVGKAARPPTAAGSAPARAAGGKAGGTARRMEKHEATARGGATPMMSAGGAVLRECASSAENVQAPSESVEAWVACEGGGFAPLVTA